MTTGALRLQLFVASGQPSSELALARLLGLLRRLELDPGLLDIVDVLVDPARAWNERVLATPTLVRVAPEPRIQWIGTLDDLPMLERALGIDARPRAGD